MADIGFLGTGAIAAAMVGALAGQGHRIAVSDRNARVAGDLAARYAEVTVADNAAVVARSQMVICCLMADTARSVLPGLPFRADQTILSVMADVSLAELATLTAPAADRAIFIPMPFVAQGGCPLPVTPDSPALRSLFGQRNPVIPCRDESALNAHFAACALASVTFAQLQETARWLAGHTGDAAAAESYVTQLLAGYLPNITSLKGALDDLDTDGGFNQTLRRHMDPATDRLHDGLTAFEDRLGLN